MTVPMPIAAIRPATPGDDPIVFDGWSSSMADELDIEDPDERKRFKRGQKPILAALMARGHTLVAASKDGRVMGFIAYETPDVVHFVYVKKPFREGQIARRLVAAAGLPPACRASHSTSWGFPRVAKLFASLTHHPELGAP